MRNNCSSLLAASLLFSSPLTAQTLLNGSFENNTATLGSDMINIVNSVWNNTMADSYAFGDWNGGGDNGGDLDIMSTGNYCGAAHDGNWCVALTAGGSDAFSLTLSSPLVAGHSYSVRFYDRICGGFSTEPVEVGVSDVHDAFGSLVYAAPTPIVDAGWTQRSGDFVAPINGQYLTVRCGGLNSGSPWTQVDDFVLSGGTTDGINDAIVDAWRIYNRAGGGMLRIEGIPASVHRIDLMEASGRVVRSITPLSTAVDMATNDLASGVYLLRADTDRRARKVHVE